MSEARVKRRLAAILAADVAGYSRLMGMDEEGTLAQLKAHRRALIDPKITEHRGRIVKTTGDGMLVEFASVVDALRCAVEVQRGMAERNAEVPPDKRTDGLANWVRCIPVNPPNRGWMGEEPLCDFYRWYRPMLKKCSQP